MEPVNIHIATHKKYVKYFVWLTKLVGAVFSVEISPKRDLRAVIDKAEKEFAEGKSKIMTIDELRALTNEIAQH